MKIFSAALPSSLATPHPAPRQPVNLSTGNSPPLPLASSLSPSLSLSLAPRAFPHHSPLPCSFLHPLRVHPRRTPAQNPPPAWDHLLSIPAPFPVIPVKSITRWRQRRWCCSAAGGAAGPGGGDRGGSGGGGGGGGSGSGGGGGGTGAGAGAGDVCRCRWLCGDGCVAVVAAATTTAVAAVVAPSSPRIRRRHRDGEIPSRAGPPFSTATITNQRKMGHWSRSPASLVAAPGRSRSDVAPRHGRPFGDDSQCEEALRASLDGDQVEKRYRIV